MAKKKVTKKKKPAKKKAAKKAVKKKAAPKKKKAAAKKTKKKVAKKAAKKSAPKKTMKKASAKKAAPKAKKTAAPKAVESSNPSGHALIGESLPGMVLQNQNGQEIDLGAVTSEEPKVVLYFYPKDDTPGCTKEACDFRDNINRIQSAGIRVLGVSPDDPESHQKFIQKYGLNFDLLSDTNHALADALKVWKEKNFMGKSYMGVERSTFLIEDGRIRMGWQPVKVEGHVDEVLAAAGASQN